jgi:phage terminase large subunit
MSDEMRVPDPRVWRPRDYQWPLWQHLNAGGLRADVVAHRRWGKDDVALHWAAAASRKRVGSYWHLLPEIEQGRKAIWSAVNPHTGRKRIDEAFPARMRVGRKTDEMRLTFTNGSTWQVAGSDNYNSLVGSSPAGVVFSEWSLAKPEAWSFIRPILAENGGWALFLWTPRGRGHATRAFDSRVLRPDEWFCQKQPATETDVFSDAQLKRERAELIAELGSEEEGQARYASEYLVDFDAAAPGAYYAGLLGEAERDGRIGRVPWDPALKVDTAWDLGIDDYTAVWFFQQVGREVRAIDYFETSGEGLAAIVRQALAGRPYVYGTHHLPHDVMVRELGAAGRSRFETLGGLGVSPISVGAAMDPEERINAGRLMIPMTWFDAEKCAGGLERLRGYRKRWVKATRSYGGPLHDEASHGADAFGEFAANRHGGAVVKRPGVRRLLGAPLGWMG